ncbi:hypothetical protein [Trueperella pyogenes]|uniref:hypothetical protein n=1 Tax=Trueperella pyogenes TaxID=1661 RepID=UPI0032487A33
MKFLLGALTGFFAALIATIVFPGPLDLPVVGFCLGIAILAAGAWFMWEWGKFFPWLGYVGGTFATTAWLTYFPPSGDTLRAASPGWTNAWVVAAALAVVLPALLAARLTKKRAGGETSDS